MKLRFLLFPIAWCSAAAIAESPYIVHVSDTLPSYTMVLTGGGYDPQTVRVLMYVPGPRRNMRESISPRVAELAKKFTGKIPPLPLGPPAEGTFEISPVYTSERCVYAELPRANLPPGYLAIAWLRDGKGLSLPVIVNRPEAWYLLKPVCGPGEMNRLYGANLLGDKYVPDYVFLMGADGRVTELKQEKRHREDGWSNRYCIQFRIPEGTPAGKYRVFAHSNSGDSYGFTRLLPLEIRAGPRFPGRLFHGAEHGLKGDSVTDNLKPLQEVIDKAGDAGGGIVFLPAGAFRISDTLQLRANVILRGAGINATTLFYQGRSRQKGQHWLISARDVDHTGLEDLTIRTGGDKDLALSYYKDRKPIYDSHILRCRFLGGTVSVHYGIRMDIGHSLFERAVLHVANLEHGWVHDNEFTLGRLRGSPVHFWATENCTIEHNRAFRSNRGFVWQIHGFFGHYHNFIGSNVTEEARMGGNAGETFLFEGSGFRWYGRPRSVRPDGFEVKNVNWQENSLKKAFAVVVRGKGSGQYVRIAGNTGGRVRLEMPWPVLPSGNVRISILFGVVDNVFVNNRDVRCDNSMMWFGAGAINNCIIRNRSENSLGISMWSHADLKKNVLVPDYFNLFESNVIEDQGAFWLTKMASMYPPAGIRNMGNILRANFIADTRRKRENQYSNVWEHSHGMYRPVQAAIWLNKGRDYEKAESSPPLWSDTLIERNYITRCRWGIEMSKWTRETVVRKNTFFDVARPIIDHGQGNRVEDNRFESFEKK